jgi:spermidine/putrescine-binding protein
MRRSVPGRWIAAALLMLVPATIAHAGCAWVLWGSYTRASDLKEEHFLSKAFESKAECDGEADTKNARSMAREKANPGKYGLGAASSTFFSCLPDTIDPRGPKGK